MRLEVLGCDGGIGKGLRTTAFLLDGDIMIDAGSGAGDLTGEAMQQIDHVFLTHAHIDHIAFLPPLIDTSQWPKHHPITVHATEKTVRVLKDHIFNWAVWPDLSDDPFSKEPALRYSTVEVGQTVILGERRITPVPANHTIPTVGYQLDSGDASLVFTGDTTRCEDLWSAVNRIENLKYLVIEISFSDDRTDFAVPTGHLTPRLLAEELRQLKRPAEVFVTHRKPAYRQTILEEIGAIEWEHPVRPLSRGQIIEF